MDSNYLQCPKGHDELVATNVIKEKKFRGKHIKYQIEAYICQICGVEVGTIDQAARAQLAIAEAYRKEVGLLTSAEIKSYRKQFGWSQQDLAKKTGLGISSIKRWELGIIQTKPMDRLLRDAFQGKKAGNIYTGNRKFSLERIKLVMKEFERKLRVRLLEDGDMLLHDAKYVWYADMVAYRDLGRGMTGAAYGALPYGPQLNNYRDLVESIRNSDETLAEPLTDDEKKIITKIAQKFPTKQMVYDASHREPAWINKAIGSIMLYSDSQKLQEI